MSEKVVSPSQLERSSGENQNDADTLSSAATQTGRQTSEVQQQAAPAKAEGSDIVDWDGDDDPQDPMNWTTARKWTVIGLVAAITFNGSVAATIFAPGVPDAQRDFNDHNSAEGSLLVSIYIIGLAVGPLFLSPASELYGRAPATHISNIVFLISSILCAVSVNIPMLLVFRLVMGLAVAVPLTLGGGVIGDLIVREERGKALGIWTIGPLLGPVVGPVMGGYLSLNVGWRWTYWLIAIIGGVLTIACFVFYRETYAPRLLELKLRRLRKETGNSNLRTKFDKGQTPGQHFRAAIVRPAKFLVRSPIVLILSLFVSVAYSYMYLLFTTFTSVFEGEYGFNSGEAGLAYLGLGVGFIVGLGSLTRFSDWYLKRQKAKVGHNVPEDRLPPLILGSFLLPIGLFWYGWTAEEHVHWIAPIIGSGFCGLGILYIWVPVQMYLVDAYTLYAVSALAANTVVRSIFGTCIPLAGPALYARLRLGWGNSLLGFLALAFAPFSFVFLMYGERIRKNPKFQPSL